MRCHPVSAVATQDSTHAGVGPRRPRRRGGTGVWLTVAVAVLVLVLADLGVNLAASHLSQPIAWPSAELQHKYDRISSAGADHPVTTVLFGDSLLDAAGDPARMTALPGRTFNASLAGEVLSTIASWATRVVVPRLHPATVVLGFSVNVLKPDSPGAMLLESNYNASREVHVVEGQGSVLDHLDSFLRAHVALYRYRSDLRAVFQPSGGVGATVYDPPLSPAGWNEGFRHYDYTLTPAQGEAEMRSNLLQDFSVSATQEARLGAFIDELRHLGARVVLVAMPVTADFTASIPGGRPAYDAALQAMLHDAAQHGAVTASVGLWPDGDFTDPAHLNAAGTVRFSSWLARLLRSEMAA